MAVADVVVRGAVSCTKEVRGAVSCTKEVRGAVSCTKEPELAGKIGEASL